MKFFHYDKTLSIMKMPQGTMTLSRIFRSYGKPKISVCVSLTMNCMNAALDYLIIFRPIELSP